MPSRRRPPDTERRRVGANRRRNDAESAQTDAGMTPSRHMPTRRNPRPAAGECLFPRVRPVPRWELGPAAASRAVCTGRGRREAGAPPDGPEHALPPHRRVLGRPGERRCPGPVGRSHALPRLDGARPRQPRRRRGPMDGAAGRRPHHRRRGHHPRRRPPRRRPGRVARWTPPGRRPPASRRRCRRAARSTCRTATPRSATTSTSWRPTTSSTAGTWRWPPVATPGSTHT